jgi:hypothetical protein
MQQTSMPILEARVGANLDSYFGICPECGGCDGRKNIGRGHWRYCARHRLKWGAGENFFDDWRAESMEDWWQNFLFLERLRLCEASHPEPNRRVRFVRWLRDWKHVFGRRRIAVGDEELPF